MEPLGPVAARYLLDHEVDYELDIRDCYVQRPAKEKKTILSRLLAKEKEKQRLGSLIVSGAHKYEFIFEQTAIDKSLTSIRDLVSDFEGNSKDPSFPRIRARLNHVSGRVLHFPTPEDATEAVKIHSFKKDIFTTCLQLEAELLEKAEKGDTARPPSPFLFPTPVVNVAPPVVTCSSQRVLISDWGIKFDGDSRNLYSFLERTQLLAQSREVSEDALFKSAVELFVGDAFAWYKCIMGSVTNWQTLVERLKKDFLPLDADEDLWSQIKSRRQKRNESVHIFIAHLDILFNRLSRPPAEVSKVKYIRQNLIPEFSSHLGLCDIQTVNELTSLCRKLEENLNIKNRPSSSQTVSTLSYDARNNFNDSHVTNFNDSKPHKKFVKRDNKRSPRNFNTFSQSGSSNSPVKKVNSPSCSGDSKNNKKDSIVCWNCD